MRISKPRAPRLSRGLVVCSLVLRQCCMPLRSCGNVGTYFGKQTPGFQPCQPRVLHLVLDRTVRSVPHTTLQYTVCIDSIRIVPNGLRNAADLNQNSISDFPPRLHRAIGVEISQQDQSQGGCSLDKVRSTNFGTVRGQPQKRAASHVFRLCGIVKGSDEEHLQDQRGIAAMWVPVCKAMQDPEYSARITSLGLA